MRFRVSAVGSTDLLRPLVRYLAGEEWVSYCVLLLASEGLKYPRTSRSLTKRGTRVASQVIHLLVSFDRRSRPLNGRNSTTELDTFRALRFVMNVETGPHKIEGI